MYTILSVDWDYFFPNTMDFDWGHRETVFFNEAIWSLRAGAVGILSGKAALDVMRPSGHQHFWDSFGSPNHLIVAESHLSLLMAMRQQDVKDTVVWNVDAHHDLGYGMKEENCGNWAKVAFEEGRIAEYNLVYPKWRLREPENEKPPTAPDGLPFEYFYGVPEITDIDVIFICRSGSWTPTWCDAAWLKFIGHFKQWQWIWNSKQYAEMALKRRSPNMIEAKRIKSEQNKVFKKLGVLPRA